MYELYKIDQAKQTRVQQAFTFGLKLQKDGLPERYKLFSSLSKIARNQAKFGLTKGQVKSIKQ